MKFLFIFIKVIEYLVIRTSNQFDNVYYLIRYPDCRLADIDPLWHYVTYAWKEGCKPSRIFDAEAYLLGINYGITPLTIHIIKI